MSTCLFIYLFESVDNSTRCVLFRRIFCSFCQILRFYEAVPSHTYGKVLSLYWSGAWGFCWWSSYPQWTSWLPSRYGGRKDQESVGVVGSRMGEPIVAILIVTLAGCYHENELGKICLSFFYSSRPKISLFIHSSRSSHSLTNNLYK